MLGRSFIARKQIGFMVKVINLLYEKALLTTATHQIGTS